MALAGRCDNGSAKLCNSAIEVNYCALQQQMCLPQSQSCFCVQPPSDGSAHKLKYAFDIKKTDRNELLCSYY